MYEPVSAADRSEHRLVIHGNEAFKEADLQACPTAGENPVDEPEPLQRVPPQWLRRQASLCTLARRPHTGVYTMPQLSMQGAFRIEALLGSIVLQYPGVPLNLLKRIQVRLAGSMVTTSLCFAHCIILDI